MQRLKNISEAQTSRVSLQFRRFLFYRMDLTAQVSGIVGPRGTGKSFLLRQLGKDKLKDAGLLMFFHMADPFFASTSLATTGDQFYQQGGQVLLLDDLHRYPEALEDMRYLTQQYPDLKIVFTCSSAGNEEGLIYELSRMAELHYLPVMSYREYLEFQHGLKFPIIRFDELLDYNLAPGAEVYHQMRPLRYFDDYLSRGAYPISSGESQRFERNLLDLVLRAISEDIMAIWHMDYDSLMKVNRILNEIANRGLFKPNIEKMATAAGTSRDSLLKFLKYLHKAGLIGWLTSGNEDINYFNKPDRLFLNDSNLLYVLADPAAEMGIMKEVFMLNQLSIHHQVNLIGDGAYLVNLEHQLVRGWDHQPVKVTSNLDYYIDDQLEKKQGNRIPLWMLGFFY